MGRLAIDRRPDLRSTGASIEILTKSRFTDNSLKNGQLNSFVIEITMSRQIGKPS